MKKILIPLFIFIGVTVIGTTLLSFNKVNFVKQEKIIHITPLGNVDQKYLKLVKGYIQNFYGFKCVIDKQEPLSKDILAKSRTRYEASKIISKYDSDKNVLLLTDVDIAYHNKKRNIKEYGIIGLGFRPGTTCVVSTFRIKKRVGEKKMLDRLKKVSIHEVGHNLGLDHCNYDIECLMNDARGTVKQIDRERVWLCDNCRKIIRMK
jgi:archaemetzincin